jgi:uncharacterized protein (DUF1800 family)
MPCKHLPVRFQPGALAMESLHGLLAAFLCFTLCLPAPIFGAQQTTDPTSPQTNDHFRPKYASGQLQGNERILHALDRFTFGLRPGDLEGVRAMGLDKWFDQQLQPKGLDESDLNARLANFPAMQWSLQDLFFALPSNPIIRQVASGRLQAPSSGILHAVYENQIYRLQSRRSPSPEMSAAAANAAQPALDQTSIQSIFALPPEQRVQRLQSMQPAQFESLIMSLRPVQRQALTAGMRPDLKEAVEALENPEQTVVRELLAERLARDIYSNAQLREVMTEFWLNHFSVNLNKNEQMPYYLVSYERDVIRPNALGNFEDLLEAVAHSPAMLLYLDNAQSIGPHSPAARRAKMAAMRLPGPKAKVDAGLNENYARELMELHTLGVNGGYTQADVIQVARILTGWTVDRPQLGGGFLFAPQRHEPGTKKVLGKKIKENGEMEGRELLHLLATQPATAQFISRKLAIRFVSDDPPQALVDRMAKSYLKSGGNIPTVLKTLFHSPEFWDASDDRSKVKTPLEFVVSAVRASNANIDNFQPLVNALRQMGMPLYGCIQPNGYGWNAASWVSAGALVDRMNFALALAANQLPGITVEWAPDLDMSALDSDAPLQQVIPTPQSEEARLARMLMPGGISVATKSAALEEFRAQFNHRPTSVRPVAIHQQAPGAKAPNSAPADTYEREDQLLAGLLLGSPEFQRR